MKLLRVRMVVEDFAGALPFYATLLDGPCVTRAPDVDADVARLVRAGGEVVDEPRDVAPGATRFARVRAADGGLVEVAKPQVPMWGPLPQPPREAPALD